MFNKKVIFIVVTFFLLIQPLSLASRPYYTYGYDAYAELPSFPDDFFEIQSLLSSQSIQASQIDVSYYQPEILPTWSSMHEEIYGSEKTYANQGIFIYPSRFDVYGSISNETINLSALVYAHPGVSTYQGTELYLVCNESLADAQFTCNPIYLLGPTYPVFKIGWMQLITFSFTIYDEYKNITISIKERDPPEIKEKEFKEQYGKAYSACGSLLSESIDRCRVYIHGKGERNETKEETTKNIFHISSLIPFFIIFALLMFVSWLIYALRKKKEREQESS